MTFIPRKVNFKIPINSGLQKAGIARPRKLALGCLFHQIPSYNSTPLVRLYHENLKNLARPSVYTRSYEPSHTPKFEWPDNTFMAIRFSRMLFYLFLLSLFLCCENICICWRPDLCRAGILHYKEISQNTHTRFFTPWFFH